MNSNSAPTIKPMQITAPVSGSVDVAETSSPLINAEVLVYEVIDKKSDTDAKTIQYNLDDPVAELTTDAKGNFGPIPLVIGKQYLLKVKETPEHHATEFHKLTVAATNQQNTVIFHAKTKPAWYKNKFPGIFSSLFSSADDSTSPPKPQNVFQGINGGVCKDYKKIAPVMGCALVFGTDNPLKGARVYAYATYSDEKITTNKNNRMDVKHPKAILTVRDDGSFGPFPWEVDTEVVLRVVESGYIPTQLHVINVTSKGVCDRSDIFRNAAFQVPRNFVKNVFAWSMDEPLNDEGLAQCMIVTVADKFPEVTSADLPHGVAGVKVRLDPEPGSAVLGPDYVNVFATEPVNYKTKPTLQKNSKHL